MVTAIPAVSLVISQLNPASLIAHLRADTHLDTLEKVLKEIGHFSSDDKLQVMCEVLEILIEADSRDCNSTWQENLKVARNLLVMRDQEDFEALRHHLLACIYAMQKKAPECEREHTETIRAIGNRSNQLIFESIVLAFQTEYHCASSLLDQFKVTKKWGDIAKAQPHQDSRARLCMSIVAQLVSFLKFLSPEDKSLRAWEILTEIRALLSIARSAPIPNDQIFQNFLEHLERQFLIDLNPLELALRQIKSYSPDDKLEVMCGVLEILMEADHRYSGSNWEENLKIARTLLVMGDQEDFEALRHHLLTCIYAMQRKAPECERTHVYTVRAIGNRSSQLVFESTILAFQTEHHCASSPQDKFKITKKWGNITKAIPYPDPRARLCTVLASHWLDYLKFHLTNFAPRKSFLAWEILPEIRELLKIARSVAPPNEQNLQDFLDDLDKQLSVYYNPPASPAASASYVAPPHARAGELRVNPNIEEINWRIEDVFKALANGKPPEEDEETPAIEVIQLPPPPKPFQLVPAKIAAPPAFTFTLPALNLNPVAAPAQPVAASFTLPTLKELMKQSLPLNPLT